MNRMQRNAVVWTLVAVGALCLWKAWVRIYEPSHEFFGLHTDATVNWSGTPMGWVLGGVAAFGAAAILRLGGPKD
jgi:hypothetical protein